MKQTNRKEALALAMLYNKWLSECALTKSDCTIRSYESTINSFIRYLSLIKKQSIDGFAALDAFSPENVIGWVTWLAEKGKEKPQSCNVRLSNLKSFLRYLSNKNPRYASAYMQVKDQAKPLAAEKRQICSIPKEAMKALLSMPDTKTFVGMRDFMLMSLMYATGCRIDEALSVKLKDVRLSSNNPFVTLLTKGKIIRSPYLPKRVVQNLKRYIKEHHPEGAPERYLFFSPHKGPFDKLSQEAVRKRLRQYATDAHAICADVPINFHSHQFRHSMAVHRLEDGINIVQLSKDLCHSKLETTMVYLDVVPGKKEKAIADLESESIKCLPKKWHKSDGNLMSLFKRNNK